MDWALSPVLSTAGQQHRHRSQQLAHSHLQHSCCQPLNQPGITQDHAKLPLHCPPAPEGFFQAEGSLSTPAHGASSSHSLRMSTLTQSLLHFFMPQLLAPTLSTSKKPFCLRTSCVTPVPQCPLTLSPRPGLCFPSTQQECEQGSGEHLHPWLMPSSLGTAQPQPQKLWDPSTGSKVYISVYFSPPVWH